MREFCTSGSEGGRGDNPPVYPTPFCGDTRTADAATGDVASRDDVGVASSDP